MKRNAENQETECFHRKVLYEFSFRHVVLCLSCQYIVQIEDIWTSYIIIWGGSGIHDRRQCKREMYWMYKVGMHLYETYVPLLSLSVLPVLGPSTVYSTCIMSASYALQWIQAHTISLLKAIILCMQSLVPPIFSRRGNAATGSTSVPKRLPEELDDPIWNARYLIPRRTILAKGRQERKINFLSLTPSN